MGEEQFSYEKGFAWCDSC